jgi:hypothetical protein
MDKVKAQASQLAQQAQQGVAQGQAKLSDMQVRKQADALLRDLGAAVYAAHRQGGPHEPIEAALAALDAHVTAHGAIDTTPRAAEPAAAGAPPQAGPAGAGGAPPQAGPADAGGASYNLDDL